MARLAAARLAELRIDFEGNQTGGDTATPEPDTAVAEELRRVAETYARDLDRAEAYQETLEQALAEAVRESKLINQNRIRLRELEDIAATSRSLHTSTLQRYEEAVQQSLLPVGDGVQVLISARTPDDKSQPRPLLVFAFAGAFGLTLGVGAALARERLTSGFEAVWQVDPALGIGAVGALPRVRRMWRRSRASERTRTCASPAASGRAVLDAPRSTFAEVIRAVRLAVDARRNDRRSSVVGIVSAVQGEGRGTVCTNLAQVIGKTGNTVLVVDADIADARLSRSLTGTSPAGLAQVLSGEATFDDVVWRDPLSGGWFVPAGSGRDAVAERCLVASERMKAFVKDAASKFDYVILRLPPAGTTADAAAAAGWVDAFVLVVEWRKTPRDAVVDAMAASRSLQGKTVGAVLNKVNLTSLRRSGSYRGRRLFYSYP